MSAGLATNVRRLLVLGAHSDDIEIGCGGTLLQLLEEHPETDVDWVVLSGGYERETEARRSADWMLLRCTGRVNVRVEAFRDSYFPTRWDEIKDYFHALSQEVCPDLILTHRQDDRHQDHRVVSELTACAFRDHRILEYEIPKYDGDLGQPNVFIPLSPENARRKCALLMECFQSQRNKHWFTEETFQSLLRLRGLECNSPSGMAEGFYCRKLRMSAGELLPTVAEADNRPISQSEPVGGCHAGDG